MMLLIPSRSSGSMSSSDEVVAALKIMKLYQIKLANAINPRVNKNNPQRVFRLPVKALQFFSI